MAMPEADQTFCADRLKVLANPTRLAIVCALIKAPQHVGELNDEIGIDQSLLSHHLRVLRDSGLVTSRRDGKAVLYELAPDVRLTSQRNGIQLDCCVLSFE